MTTLRRVWVPLTLAMGGLVLLSPMLSDLSTVGATDDWRWFHLHWEASRAALMLHGELPGWNPYHCGGHVHWANPQTQFLSPAWWPTLGIGAPAGLKLFTALHLIAGLLAMAWLARDLGLTGAALCTACAVWALSGFFAWHIGGGHVAFQPFWYAPAALAAWRRSLMDARWMAAVAGILALMALEGGVYPVPFTALLLLIHAIHRTVTAERGPRPLVGLAASGLVAGLLAGVKIGPVVAFLEAHPRAVSMEDRLGVPELLTMFVSRSQELRFGDHVFVRPEYASYVGVPIVVALALLAFTGGLRRHTVWWIGLAAFAALTLGDHGVWSPWALLHSAPIFGGLRVPSRFAVMVTLHLAVLSGFAVAALQGWVRNRPGQGGPARLARVLPVVFALAVTFDLASLGRLQFDRFDSPTPPAVPTSAATFRMTRTPWRQAWALPARSEGTTTCYEPHRLPPGKVRADRPHEAYPAGAARGRVRVATWSPGRVEVRGELETAGLVVLNQNDHAGWTVDGGVRASHRGLPASELPPGPFMTTFVYRIPGLALGAFASLLGLMLTWVLARTTDDSWRALGASLSTLLSRDR